MPLRQTLIGAPLVLAALWALPADGWAGQGDLHLVAPAREAAQAIQLARQANLVSHSYGKEPHRRVRIFRE